MKRTAVYLTGGAIALLCAGILIGRGTARRHATDRYAAAGTGHAELPAAATLWTCSMHPQIKLPQQGKCPICFMDLIPLEPSGTLGADEGPSRIALSPLARKLAAITTVPAVRRGLSTEIRLAGKVAIDETRREVIASRIMGRIDRPYVASTGISVRKGDHLAELYSPDLVNVQQELLVAASALAAAPDSNLAAVRRRTVDAAREKLRLLGFTSSDIDGVLSRNTPSDHMTIRSGQNEEVRT